MGEQAVSAPQAESTHKLPVHPLLAVKGKSNRGRKKKALTPELMKEQAKKRMERNRLNAKENREKKKKYIAQLEAEVI